MVGIKTFYGIVRRKNDKSNQSGLPSHTDWETA
jgi:hypothetical protein